MAGSTPKPTLYLNGTLIVSDPPKVLQLPGIGRSELSYCLVVAEPYTFRKSGFRILPEAVRGMSSTKTMDFGILYRASFPSRKLSTCPSVSSWPERITIAARGTSPHLRSEEHT